VSFFAQKTSRILTHSVTGVSDGGASGSVLHFFRVCVGEKGGLTAATDVTGHYPTQKTREHQEDMCFHFANVVAANMHLTGLPCLTFLIRPRRFGCVTAVLLSICRSAYLAPAQAQVQKGYASFSDENLEPGKSFGLTGEWLYKPGYSLATNDKPELSDDSAGYVPVPVPQLLNRIHWWLDDSEDFKKDEEARLKRLGFDTEKAEDGWYRLNLNLPAFPKDRRVFVQFEGVAMKTKAFCNGSLLGQHTGMFSRFEFDLSPHLKTGTNLIAVYVSMERIPKSDLAMGEAVTVNLTASKVRSLSKGMYGPLTPGFDNRSYDLHGIWQPVRLLVRGAASLGDVWFAPSMEGAEVRVEASSTIKRHQVFLKAKWTDVRAGKIFAEVEPEKMVLNGHGRETLWLRNVTPKLWTPAEPNLYRLEVTLEDAKGQLLDLWSHKVGFRTFEVRGNQLFLNGNPYWLRGANHLPYGKNPFDPELSRRLIQLLHDANVRVTRTHATPWNEAWLEAADEIGLGVSVEGIRPWALAGKIGITPPDLLQHWLMENEDVIKRCRNHPSVLIYTVGNEMMLRDEKNPDKWKQLSTVVKATRGIDPTRPVIASSEYQREPETYRSLLQPNGFDDGDVDDVHRYNNWYAPSCFVNDSLFESELSSNLWKRPFIGQEMSTGYPDLDTGLPVPRYTRDLLTPQAWVGQYAYPKSDPAIFLEHHRAVTKRWAEQLRYQRAGKTAGFMLFAAECWFSHSYDPARVQPYPVYDSIKEAWAPMGIALETGRRRFYGGEQVETAVFLTNDDDQYGDHQNLDIHATFQDARGKEITNAILGSVPKLEYYAARKLPLQLRFPQSHAKRQKVRLILRLVENGSELSRTTEPVELFAANALTDKISCAFLGRNLGPELKKLAEETFSTQPTSNHLVIVVESSNDSELLKLEGELRATIATGATAILLSPGTNVNFGDEVVDTKPGEAEFADWAPIVGTTLAEGLEPMDLKWWGRKADNRTFIGSQSHRLKAGGAARELLRYIPPHSYIPPDKVPEQYRTVLFEIPLGKGRIWVCDLDLEQSISVDPVARMFAENLLRAAADPDSTKKLPVVPRHEDLLK